MWELPHMVEKACPGNWGWVKCAFLTLGVMTFVGVRCRRKLPLHVSLELGSFLGLAAIFAYGVFTRGALGTAASHPHSWLYFCILFPHILAGALYALLALMLMRLGWLIVVRNQQDLLLKHQRLGRMAAWCLYISVVLAFPL